MRSLAASERQIFWMLRLPNSLPFVMAGLDVAMIFALIGAIVAEFVGGPEGPSACMIQSMKLQHGRLRAVLHPADPVGGGPPCSNRGVMMIRKARALLGSVREGAHRPGKGQRLSGSPTR